MSIVQAITDDNVEQWAIWWKNNKNEYKNIKTILLLQKLERVIMDKEYEKGYRDGLDEFINIMNQCEVEYELNKKEDKKKEDEKLRRSLRLQKSKFV